MSWIDLLTFAGTAGLLSAVLGHLFSGLGGWITRRRRARYLALRIAVLLENYGRQCIAQAGDIDTWQGSGGHSGELHLRIRLLPDLPLSSDAWEYLRADLSHRVLSIDFEVTQQNSEIAFEIDMVGEADVTSIMLRTMEAASTAIILAKDLRYAYGLPQFEPAQSLLAESAEWAERLREKQAAQSEHEREQSRKMLKAFEDNIPL